MFKKMLSLIGAIISGGVGIALVSTGRAAADEVCISCITGHGSGGIIQAIIHSAPGILIASGHAQCTSCALSTN